MDSAIFFNSGTYSYEELDCYFQTIKETAPPVDLILSYVERLIQEQPDLQKFHDLESTLNQRIKECGDDTQLANLASRVTTLMHKQMPISLVEHSSEDPESVIHILEREPDQTVILQTLLQLASYHPKHVINQLSSFPHLTLDQRVLLAEACAIRAPLYVLSKIDYFNINTEEFKLKIIKNIFSSDWDNLYDIDHISLSEQGFKDLVTYCAKLNPEALIKKYYIFNIQDSNFVSDLLFSLVKQYPELIFRCSDNFRLDPEPRAALIRECLHHSIDRAGMVDLLIDLAQRSKDDLLRIIKGQEDEELLRSIAFACARGAPQFLATHLKKFRIQDQKVLEQLARQLADQNGQILSSCIQEFGIENPDVRLELAKKVLSTSLIGDQIKNFGILREEDRCDLAIQYLQSPFLSETELTIEALAQFNIQDPTNLLKLAKVCIENFPLKAGQLIECFHIQSEQDRFNLAKTAVVEYQGRAIEHIGLFKLQNPLYRIEIARLAAGYDGQMTASHIENLNISDENSLFEIAKLCAKNNGEMIQYLELFKITDESRRLEIAMICAKTAPRAVIHHLHLVDLKDEQSRFELARAYAGIQPEIVTREIKKFKLAEENRRIIARLCLGPYLPGHFKRFEISDPQQRVELAKECGKKYPEEVARSIFEFQIEDKDLEFQLFKQYWENGKFPAIWIKSVCKQFSPDQQKEIADLLFAYNPHELIMILEFMRIDEKLKIDFLKQYIPTRDAKLERTCLCKFENKSFQLEIATLCAIHHPASFAPIVSRYGISDELERFKLAKICFERSPASISQHIAVFKLAPEHVYELAIDCAKEPKSRLTDQFYNFNLRDPEQIFNVALLSAEHNGAETAQGLGLFRISDPNHLLEVIRVCAKTAPEYIHLLIRKQNIPSDAERLALAQLAMKSSKDAIVSLPKFGIQGVTEKQELIRLYASYFPEEFKQLCVHIIDPVIIPIEEERKRLAIIACEANPVVAIQFITNFAIRDHAFVLELITKMALKTNLGFINHLFSLDWTEEESSQLYRMLRLTQKNLHLSLLSEEVFSDCYNALLGGGNTSHHLSIFQVHYPKIRKFLSAWPNVIKPEQLLPENETLSVSQMKTYAIAYIGLNILSHLALEIPDAKGKLQKLPILEIPIIKELVEKIFKHRNPSQALSYLTLLAYRSSPEMIQGLQIATQTELKRGSRETYGKPLAPLLIPMLRVSAWAAECHRPDLLHSLNQIFRKKAIRERYFKAEAASSDSMVQAWLKTVEVLDRVRELSSERKLTLLLKAAQPITALRDRLITIQAVLFSEAAEQLNRDFGPSMDEDLMGIIKEGLLADDYIDFKGVENLEGKYMQTLATLRFPNSWKIYEQHLKQSGESEVQEAYQKFIASVLNGTFRQERYETTSPHIELIRRRHEAIWQRWKEEDQGKQIELDGSNYQIINTDDWQDMFLSGTEVPESCQRIDGIGGFNRGLLSYLLDGKIRMVALKHGDTGQIYARALLKLVWNEKEKAPVLFLEKQYPSNLSEEVSNALVDYAISQAKELGCSLYSLEKSDKKQPVAHKLVSHGSCAPYEYADAATLGGDGTRLMPRGQYAIQGAFPLWLAN